MRNVFRSSWTWFIVFCIALGFIFYSFLGFLTNWALASIDRVQTTSYTKPLEVTASPKQAPQQYAEQPTSKVQTTIKPQVTKQVQVTATPPQIEQAKTISQECQYPDRLYPDGSCDNSDPACPETLKDPVLLGSCTN